MLYWISQHFNIIQLGVYVTGIYFTSLYKGSIYFTSTPSNNRQLSIEYTYEKLELERSTHLSIFLLHPTSLISLIELTGLESA